MSELDNARAFKVFSSGFTADDVKGAEPIGLFNSDGTPFTGGGGDTTEYFSPFAPNDYGIVVGAGVVPFDGDPARQKIAIKPSGFFLPKMQLTGTARTEIGVGDRPLLIVPIEHFELEVNLATPMRLQYSADFTNFVGTLERGDYGQGPNFVGLYLYPDNSAGLTAKVNGGASTSSVAVHLGAPFHGLKF